MKSAPMSGAARLTSGTVSSTAMTTPPATRRSRSARQRRGRGEQRPGEDGDGEPAEQLDGAVEQPAVERRDMRDDEAEPRRQGGEHGDRADEAQHQDAPHPRIEDIAEREGEG